MPSCSCRGSEVSTDLPCAVLQLPWSKQWLKDEAAKANLLPELMGVSAAGTGYNFSSGVSGGGGGGGGGGGDQTAFSSSVTSQSDALYDSIGMGQQQPSVYSQSLTASLGEE